MTESVWLFIGGQAVLLLVFIIKWYVQHDRLKEKIKVIEAACTKCKQETDNDMVKMRDELQKDIEEIKTDLRSMKGDLADFKLNTTGTLSEIKTLLTQRTVQL